MPEYLLAFFVSVWGELENHAHFPLSLRDGMYGAEISERDIWFRLGVSIVVHGIQLGVFSPEVAA